MINSLYEELILKEDKKEKLEITFVEVLSNDYFKESKSNPKTASQYFDLFHKILVFNCYIIGTMFK